MAHFLFQFLVHLFRLPVVICIVLYLFEVADGNSSGICEDVRYNGYAPLEENPVGFRDGRSIGKFQYELSLDSIDIFHSNLVLECCRNEDVA